MFTGALSGFPTKNGSFAILSTGRAADATTPNSTPNLSTVLSGAKNAQGNDITKLHLTLLPPAGATCAAFDFRFYSEEYPEYVGSSFNDAFVAEQPNQQQQIVNNQVVAPNNFAFDSKLKPISVNTVFGFQANTGTTYDGATPLLTATTPIEPNIDTHQVNIYLSIQDLGDSIYDSAVFVDNFRWLATNDCKAGAVPGAVDSDGDGLPDDWETKGIDVDHDGKIDVNLPAMGADPNHKDIFVEADYMQQPASFCVWFVCIGGHDHKPSKAAMQKVIDAFANAPIANPDGKSGIALHVDAGPDSVMNPKTGATWGSQSRSNSVPEQETLGANGANGYNWTAYDAVKNANFSIQRADAFHYALFAHAMPGGYSGISRGVPASDLLVTLGLDGFDHTVTELAGTFMHELGHNLGLSHGGSLADAGVNYKPNYLSVMNYSFQRRGLRDNGKDGRIDYSRTQLNAVNESALNELIGLTPSGGVGTLGTIYYCGGQARIADHPAGAVDWNCSGGLTNPAVADINGQGGLTTLNGFDDWGHIRFDGGAVGLGSKVPLPATTVVDEPTPETFSSHGLNALDYNPKVTGPGAVKVPINAGPENLPFVVTNGGTRPDTLTLTVTRTSAATDITKVPATVSLAPGKSVAIDIPVTFAAGTADGTVETVRLQATSVANTSLVDEAQANVTAVAITKANQTDILSAIITGLQQVDANRPSGTNFSNRAVAGLQAARTALLASPVDVKAVYAGLDEGDKWLTKLITAFQHDHADAVVARLQGMQRAIAGVRQVAGQ